jgi:putative flippase GtrA
MNGRSLASALGQSRTVREVMSFLAVGAAGFVIEAIILTGLTEFAAWSPWHARIPSFLMAVLVTWSLNRRHTFPNRGPQRPSLEVLLYAAIQGGGAVVNLIIFGAMLALTPMFMCFPVVALAIAAVGGFAFNYLVSSKLLYAQQRDRA